VAVGAEAVAVTSMGGHFCIRELEAISPLPILNAIPAVDVAIRQRNFEKSRRPGQPRGHGNSSLWRDLLGGDCYNAGDYHE
jgi:hypothetical protein